MPWFGFLALDDSKAREVFDIAEGNATHLFIKTRDDDEAATLARGIEIAAALPDQGLADSPVVGNLLVYLDAFSVGLRDTALQEISSVEGVTNLVEYHEFGAVTGPPPAFGSRTLVARSVTPGKTSVEISLGRALGPEDEAKPVFVVRGPEQFIEELDQPLGRRRTYNVNGVDVILETVGLTRNAPPLPGGFEDAWLLAPLGAIDSAVPRTAISFSMTVPDSQVSDIEDRLGREIPGAAVVEMPTTVSVLVARKAHFDNSSVEVETAAERLVELEDTTEVMGKFIMVVGLVSLAIGGIGILNTMLVVVGQRTQEVGVLKALGLRGREVTILFMTKGVLLGIAGAVAGVLFGVLLSFVLTGFTQQFLQTDIEWKLQAAPIYTGLVVGVVFTTVFAFLPILGAARVRPNVVLQARVSALPRAGRLVSLLVVLVLTAIMGLIATVFLGNPLIGLAGAYGALAVLTLLTVILLGVVWVLGKIPNFGSINLKLSLRGLSRQRGRAASTLLALTVGIFAMASIVVLGGSLKQLADEIAETAVGGNVLLMVPNADPEITGRASQEISTLQGLTNVVEDYQYDAVRIVAVNGERSRRWGSAMIARRGTPIEGNSDLLEGRHLDSADAGKPIVVVGSGVARDLGLHVGDDLTFDIGGRWVGDDLRDGREVDLELGGISAVEWPAQGGFVDDGGSVIPVGALDSTFTPEYAFFVMTTLESAAPAIAAQLSENVSGAISMETQTVAGVFKDILDRIAVFPTVLSIFALFAGAVIIANSVALATMERRREIAMMKAVGARGSRILISLLIENGVIGLVGGGIGAALSTIVLVVFNRFESEISATPNPLSILVVLAVAVAVALGAAIISAWPASRGKPLMVLRYE